MEDRPVNKQQPKRLRRERPRSRSEASLQLRRQYSTEGRRLLASHGDLLHPAPMRMTCVVTSVLKIGPDRPVRLENREPVLCPVRFICENRLVSDRSKIGQKP
ncbi:hypothetical protein PIB30_023467 [Stylosanthes scabra]|uniref:Uncharacterized protein n=1 Tax=Stylosanthes scabra TaxID=79078 RepID=A0ABU6R9P1_9FABA|nr:hypothetical protein [Stylosanthes scabra]